MCYVYYTHLDSDELANIKINMFAHREIYLQTIWKVKTRGGRPSPWRGSR